MATRPDPLNFMPWINNQSECARHVIQLTDTVPMAFRLIPNGEFLMGSRGYNSSEEPIHRVLIEEDFWMGETPVTQEQFSVWTKEAGIDHENHFDGRPHNPAENMSWHEASEFCNWLTHRYLTGLPDNHQLRQHRFAQLPCEGYWEYACREGTTTEYYTGDGEAALLAAGWYSQNSDSSTQLVKNKIPNEFGVFDMHGNVWEWCLDRWDGSAYRRRWDEISAQQTYLLNEQFGDRSDDPRRVLRGGSWGISAFGCRSACRFRDWVVLSYRYIGFRVCLVRSPFFGQPVAERES